MTDGGDPDRLPVVGHLVEDPVGADPQGVEAAEPSAERLTRERFALKQAERILDRVDQQPPKVDGGRGGLAGRGPVHPTSRDRLYRS